MSSTSAADQAVRDRGNAALKKQMNGEALTAAEANAIAKLERLTQREQLRAAYRRCSGEDLQWIMNDVTRMSLKRWRAEGLPQSPDGSYILRDWFRWFHPEPAPCRNCVHKRYHERRGPEVDPVREKATLANLKTRATIEQMQGEFQSLEHFKSWVHGYMTALRSRLESVPRGAATTRDEELRMRAQIRKELKSCSDEIAAFNLGFRQNRAAKERSGS